MEDLMQRFIILGAVLGLGLVACDDGIDTDILEVCEISQVKLFPEPGETRAYYRTTVEAAFSPIKDEAATLTLTGPDGEVSGTSAWSSNRLVFTPDQALTSGAKYTTAVAYSCGGEDKNPTGDFTVSEVGASTTLDSLVGNAYALGLAEARFIEPDGIAALLSQFLTFDLLVGVKSVDTGAETIQIMGALGVEGAPTPTQDCSPVIPFPEASISENPYFELGPQEFSIEVEDVVITIDDLYLSGSFAPDGSYIDGAVLSGVIDTRAFVDIVEEGGPDTAVCDLAFQLG
ncbi:MAG: hypothetical protein ACI9MC_003206, partial [Kiritimatiellia bacterium]